MRYIPPAVTLLLLVACTGEDNINQLFPDIVVAPETLEFGDVIVPYTAEAQVTITNAGRATLDVEELSFNFTSDLVSTSPFTIEVKDAESETISLGRDEVITLNVTFAPDAFLDYSGELVIVSDDPEDGVYRLPVIAEGIDGPVPDIESIPASVDFGEVSTTTSVPILITNAGDAILDITSSSISGSDAFTLVNILNPGEDPLRNASISPGGYQQVTVEYTPNNPEGESSQIVIESNDPDEPAYEILLVGNGGGGDVEYPIADVICPDQVAPPQRLTLDGRGSYDPGGHEPLTYQWSLIESPEGTISEIANPESPVAELLVDLSGTWSYQLQVTNDIGLRSAPAGCTFGARPEDLLQVELTWNTTDSDMDLHFIQDGSEFFQEPGDCCYCNRSPNWATTSDVDDPFLSLDNRVGRGPEIVSIETPANDEYFVQVHYYDDNGGGATTATARVLIGGEEVYRGSALMERNNLWKVGVIRWTDDAGVFVEDDTLLPEPENGKRKCFEN